VKGAADAYASEKGMTLANAVASLLDHGLRATADQASVVQLERQVADLTTEVEVLRQRDQAASSAYRALAQRITQPLGACPQCGTEISGHDLLVEGHCSNDECKASLTPLLGTTPDKTAKGGLNEGDLKVLLGALGLVLGIAYISQQGGGG
jgi:RNA polymerase-binding transcription factor DksA